MSADVKQWEIGIGQVGSVFLHHLDSLNANGYRVSVVKSLASALTTCPESEEEDRAIRAILCAYLSEPFRTTGRLFHIDSEGRTNEKYVSPGVERELIADLLGV